MSLRIKLGEFLLRLLFDLGTDLTKFLRQGWPLSRNVFQQYFEYKTSDRIEIAREGLAPKSQRFEWNRTTTRKWINDERCFLWMGSFYKAA